MKQLTKAEEKECIDVIFKLRYDYIDLVIKSNTDKFNELYQLDSNLFLKVNIKSNLKKSENKTKEINIDDLCYKKIQKNLNVTEYNDLYKEILNLEHRFIKKNIKLAYRYAANVKYIEFEDAFQLACIGLIKALSLFKLNKDCKFSTYANVWMRQNISRYNAKNPRITIYPLDEEANNVVSLF
jgi:DNA-directed RNA polymerase sigma subunit (sigma70/sigma32)